MHLHFYDPKRSLKCPPLAIFLHAPSGNARSYQGADIASLTQHGFACVSLEAPYSRSRNTMQPRGPVCPRNERCLWDHTVEELGLALEEANERWNCDPGRLAFVGHQLGGLIGAYWIAKGAPVRAAVLSGVIPSLTDFYRYGNHPVATEARQTEGVNLHSFEDRMGEADLLRTVPRFERTKTLIQFGIHDPWLDAEARAKATAQFAALPNVTISLVDEDDSEHPSQAAARTRVRFLEDALLFETRHRGYDALPDFRHG